MPTLLHDRSELEDLFEELATELDALHVTAEIVMVGGAWMLWHTQRAATRDVDSAAKLPAGISGAIHRIGSRHSLDSHWLNDDATSFWPSTANYADCDVAYRAGTLTVLIPSPDVMFLMKLNRSLPQDIEDMRLLWPMCDFTSPDSVAAAYAAAYPLTEDPYMASHVATVIQGL